MTANQKFFLGRFDFCSAGSFLGLSRFFGGADGTGVDNPSASNFSNTQLIMSTQPSSSVFVGLGESTNLHAELRAPIRSLKDIFFKRSASLAFVIRRQVVTVERKLMYSEPIRESSLDTGLVKALIIFILPDDQLQDPSFIIAEIRGLRIKVEI